MCRTRQPAGAASDNVAQGCSMEQRSQDHPLGAEPPEPPGGVPDVPELEVEAPERREIPDEDVNPEAGLVEPPD